MQWQTVGSTGADLSLLMGYLAVNLLDEEPIAARAARTVIVEIAHVCVWIGRRPDALGIIPKEREHRWRELQYAKRPVIRNESRVHHPDTASVDEKA